MSRYNDEYWKIEHQAPVFMRLFSGHGGTVVGPIARFPFDKLEEFNKVLLTLKFRENNFGFAEFDHAMVYRGPGGWFMVTRKIGEPMWNIVRLGGHIEDSITDDALEKLVVVMKAANIDISVPKSYLEYIPPIDKVDPIHIPIEQSKLNAISSVTIEKAQEYEKAWHEKRQKMTPEELAVHDLY
jgi:hypothetical protein